MAGPRIITLTTDFGLRDGYVACMKGVILSIAPDVRLVDVSHAVPPQDVQEGAFLLASIWRYFPTGTIHLAIVDPGVGTQRRLIAVETDRACFVGPDNGLLIAALDQMGFVENDSVRLRGAMAVELAAPEYRLHPTSQTFHGRDVFAPAAAHLAAGVELTCLGPEIDRLSPLDLPGIHRSGDLLVGTVAHIDGFGNAITNIPATELPEQPVIKAGDAEIDGLSASYQDRLLACLIGSSGYLEIAVRNGNAAHYLGLRRGDPVEVHSVR